MAINHIGVSQNTMQLHSKVAGHPGGGDAHPLHPPLRPAPDLDCNPNQMTVKELLENGIHSYSRSGHAQQAGCGKNKIVRLIDLHLVNLFLFSSEILHLAFTTFI